MGLLDEAIREHLELKRRRGADPHEVAREEQEALQPVGMGELPAWALQPAMLEPLDPIPAWEQPPQIYADELSQAPALSDEAVLLDGAAPPSAPADELAPAQASVAAAEEATVEIDMAALLAQTDDQSADVGAASAVNWPRELRAEGITVRRITGQQSLALEPEDLDWEIPSRARRRGPPGEAPAREGIAFE